MGVDHERHRAARRHPRLRRHVPGLQRLHAPGRAARRAACSCRSPTSGRTTRSGSARTARPTSRSSTWPRCGRSPAWTWSVPPTPTRPRSPGARSWSTTDRPAGLVLSRQNLPILDRSVLGAAEGTARGALRAGRGQRPARREVILLATGSEVQIALAAREQLEADGIATRVVSDAVPGVVRRAGRGLPAQRAAARRAGPGVASRPPSPWAGASSSATPAGASRSTTSAPRAPYQRPVRAVRPHRRPGRRRRARRLAVSAASPVAARPTRRRLMTDATGRPVRRRRRRLARRPVPRPAPHRQPRQLVDDPLRRRRDHEPVDLPEGAGRRLRAYDDQLHDLALRGIDVERGPADDHRRPTSAGPATCCARSSDRTDGVDGRVSIEVDPRISPRHRPHRRRGPRPVVARRPAEPVHQDPGDRRGPAGDHRDARRGDQRQRHADLQPRAVPGGHGGLPGRPGAGPGERPRPVPASGSSPRSSSPGWTPRSTTGSRRQGADVAARPRPASPTPSWPTRRYERGLRRRPLAGPAGGRGAPAAPAVGLDRGQGPGLRRHDVRRRAGRPRHGQHDARDDAARPSPTTARSAATR